MKLEGINLFLKINSTSALSISIAGQYLINSRIGIVRILTATEANGYLFCRFKLTPTSARRPRSASFSPLVIALIVLIA